MKKPLLIFNIVKQFYLGLYAAYVAYFWEKQRAQSMKFREIWMSPANMHCARWAARLLNGLMSS